MQRPNFVLECLVVLPRIRDVLVSSLDPEAGNHDRDLLFSQFSQFSQANCRNAQLKSLQTLPSTSFQTHHLF